MNLTTKAIEHSSEEHQQFANTHTKISAFNLAITMLNVRIRAKFNYLD